MISADLSRRVNSEEPKLKKVGYTLMFLGMSVIVASFVIAIAIGFSTADLFENTKTVRDAASPDDVATSGILSQQGTIAATAAWLTPFKFVGLALFLLGIGIMLLAITQTLQLRGEAMLKSLPIILGTEQIQASNGTENLQS